jgi:hypothetical protein
MVRLLTKTCCKKFETIPQEEDPEVVKSNHKLKVGNPPQRWDSLTIPPTDLF